MAEGGCTAREIMSVSGHLTLKELERYTRLADRARSAKAAMRKAGRNRKGTETTALRFGLENRPRQGVFPRFFLWLTESCRP